MQFRDKRLTCLVLVSGQSSRRDLRIYSNSKSSVDTYVVDTKFSVMRFLFLFGCVTNFPDGFRRPGWCE